MPVTDNMAGPAKSVRCAIQRIQEMAASILGLAT